MNNEFLPCAFDDNEREALLFRYIHALDSGNEWEIEAVLHAALDDIELERQIGEVHLAWTQEIGLETEAEIAVELAHKHLTLPIAEPSVLIGVDEVAGFLSAKGEPEKDVIDSLLRAKIPVPALLSRRNLENLAQQLGILADTKFWRRFKDAAITLKMQRAAPQAQLALAREAKQVSQKIDLASKTDEEAP